MTAFDHLNEFDAIERGCTDWQLRRAQIADRYGHENVDRALSEQAAQGVESIKRRRDNAEKTISERTTISPTTAPRKGAGAGRGEGKGSRPRLPAERE